MFKKVAQLASTLQAPTRTQEQTVTGWIKNIRKLKNITFIDIHNGQESLKVVIPKSVAFATERNTPLTIGECIQLQDFEIVPRARENSFELKVNDNSVVKTIGPIHADYPLQKKQTSIGLLRSFPQYKYNTNYLSSLMKFRSLVEHEFATALHKESFINVHTPIITGSDCEGAGEMFEINVPKEYFKNDAKAYLTVSTQLHLEIMAQSLGRVYTLTPCFRAEFSDTNRHLCEFWMLELEMCFVEDINELCRTSEKILKAVISNLYNNYNPDELLPKYKPVESSSISQEAAATSSPSLNNVAKIRENWSNLINSEWQILEYSKVVEILQNKIKQEPELFQYNNLKYGDELQSEHEKWLAMVHCNNKPVFVTNYPAAIKPFYMKQSKDQNTDTVANFDLLVPGMGEIIGGSLREHDYDTLLKAINERNMSIENLDWYLDLRKNGSAPHGGFGLGMERFVTYLFGNNSIKDAIPFYRAAQSSIKT